MEEHGAGDWTQEKAGSGCERLPEGREGEKLGKAMASGEQERKAIGCLACPHARTFPGGSVHCKKYDIPKYNTTKCVGG